MKDRLAVIMALFLSLLLLTAMSDSLASATTDSATQTPFVYSITITGVITNGTTEYIRRSVEMAESDNAAALVMRINTPGGIVDSTLEILEIMLASQVPIITYVEPQGAIAASAGSFILIGGHIAAMSPGTTCGAAMPVTFSFSEEGTSTNTADQKTINFLAGHIRSVAEERNHNGDIAEKFVTENLTLDVNEALDEKIIDLTARTIDELLDQSNGMSVILQGVSATLETTDTDIIPISMTSRESATGFISNPQISFLLVIIGIYGLVIGFNAPHTYIPEAAGAIALVLGLFGLGMFQINIFAILLLGLGVLLLIAEALTPTYGVLSVTGIIGIILGGFFLPKEPLMPQGWFIGLRALSIGIAIGASVLMMIVLRGIIKARHNPIHHGSMEFFGLSGTIIEADGTDCLVLVNGEIWRAKTEDSQPLYPNQRVKIIRREGIDVIVVPSMDSKVNKSSID